VPRKDSLLSVSVIIKILFLAGARLVHWRARKGGKEGMQGDGGKGKEGVGKKGRKGGERKGWEGKDGKLNRFNANSLRD